jgi:hypothetical protein
VTREQAFKALLASGANAFGIAGTVTGQSVRVVVLPPGILTREEAYNLVTWVCAVGNLDPAEVARMVKVAQST